MSDRIAQGLSASARVMLGESGAARDIDGSGEAVRFSFLGLALAVFMDAAIVSAGSPGDGRTEVFLWLLVLDVASYAAAVAVILVLTREPEHRKRFPSFLAAQNWGEAVLAAVFAVPKYIYVTLPPVQVEGAQVTGSPLIIISIVVGLVVATFVARYRLLVHVLGVSGVRAFWMVIAAMAAASIMAAVLS